MKKNKFTSEHIKKCITVLKLDKKIMEVFFLNIEYAKYGIVSLIKL